MKNKTNGFSIVELIIIIAVIGVLAAILVPILSNVIKDSQDASALSDARNTLTDMNVEQMTGSNAIIAVEKGERVYVYGWFAEQKELIEGRFNPYKNKDNKPLRDFLKENDCFLSGSEPQDITENLGSPLSSITVYGNTSLTAAAESISLSQAKVGMAVGETYELRYTIKPIHATPILPITFESSDDNIVSVDNGTLTAKKLGKATITAKFGTAFQTCEVTVTEWYDYTSGSLGELKSLIESTDEDVKLIRFPKRGYFNVTNVEDLLPIVVLKNKAVRIDMNNSSLLYFVAETETPDTPFLINDGGYLSIESHHLYKSGWITIMEDGSGHELFYEDVPFILNVNGGALSVDAIDLNSRVHNESIRNIGSDCWLNGTITGRVINEPGSNLVVRNHYEMMPTLSITNYGVISEIRGVEKNGNSRPIINYGIINAIIDSNLHLGVYSKDNEDGVTDQACIRNVGENAVVGNIINSWLDLIGIYNIGGYHYPRRRRLQIRICNLRGGRKDRKNHKRLFSGQR